MSKAINIDLLDNVTGGVGTSRSGGRTSKEEILKQMEKIQERIKTETNPVTLMKLNAEFRRLRQLYDSMR